MIIEIDDKVIDTIKSNAMHAFMELDGKYVFDFTEEGRQLAFVLQNILMIPQNDILFVQESGDVVNTDYQPINRTKRPNHFVVKKEDLIVGHYYRNVETDDTYQLVSFAKTQNGTDVVIFKSTQDSSTVAYNLGHVLRPNTFVKHLPKDSANFMFVTVYDKENNVVESGTYNEIIDYVRNNIVKNDSPMHMASATYELEKRGYRVKKQSHTLSQDYFR